MKFYADITTPEQTERVLGLASNLIGSNYPLSITITNRMYAKLEYFGKWVDFEKIIKACNLERYKFQKG